MTPGWMTGTLWDNEEIAMKAQRFIHARLGISEVPRKVYRADDVDPALQEAARLLQARVNDRIWDDDLIKAKAWLVKYQVGK